jgi:hypothetical protein
MLFAQHRLPQSECLSMHLFRLLVLALIPQHSCQVVLARQCGRMLFTQHRLTQPEFLSMHLFRLLVLALTNSALKCWEGRGWPVVAPRSSGCSPNPGFMIIFSRLVSGYTIGRLIGQVHNSGRGVRWGRGRVDQKPLFGFGKSKIPQYHHECVP